MQPVFLFRYPHKYHSFAQALGALMDSCFVWFKYWEFHFIPVFFHSFFFEINVFFHSCSSWYLMTNSSPFCEGLWYNIWACLALHCRHKLWFLCHSLLGGFLVLLSWQGLHSTVQNGVEPLTHPQWDLKSVYSHMCRCRQIVILKLLDDPRCLWVEIE